MSVLKQAELRELFNQMTLDEKIGQTVQLTGDFFKKDSGVITGPVAEMDLPESTINHVGSLVGVVGAEEMIGIQKKYLENNRLGIPLLFMADVIHGYQTIFPIPLGMASSWNPELIKEVASVSAKEASVSGVHVTFSPMVDLVRDARWGRVMESTGEDSYLNEIYAKAFVEGYQGDDLLEDFTKVIACVKHFAGYGAAIAGRDYNTVDISEQILREYHLPSYKAALDAGSKMVMTSFNTINSIPATSNKWLMKDVLRKEFGFEGVLITDWGATRELITHGTADSLKSAAKQTLEAGVDIDMMSGGYAKHLKELIEKNPSLSEQLDNSVWRILNLKNDLGLFENPYRGADVAREKEVVMHRTHQKLAREVAEESIVLLKNEGVLPLNKDQKVVLIGPKLDTGDILGSWSLEGSTSDTKTLKEAFIDKIGTEHLIFLDEKELLMDNQIAQMQEADVVIAVLGETSEMSGEAASRSNIKLPSHQLFLLEKLRQYAKPILSILFSGRPLDLSEVSKKSDGILQAWFPGSEGANALINILYGMINPSAKLTMSFPRNVGQLPIYYNMDTTGRPLTEENKQFKYVSKYLDVENSPLYPFGYGLSYTEFSYSNLKVSKTEFSINETLRVSIDVTNIGDRSGSEIVQLYIRDQVAEVVRPIKELKKFQKISLEKEETKTVIFELNEKDLSYTHSDFTFRSDPGEFTIMVGPNSEELESVTVLLIEDK